MKSNTSTRRLNRSIKNLMLTGMVLFALSQALPASAATTTTNTWVVKSDIQRMYDLLRMRTCFYLGIVWHP